MVHSHRELRSGGPRGRSFWRCECSESLQPPRPLPLPLTQCPLVLSATATARRTKVLLALREEGRIPKRRHQLTQTSCKKPRDAPQPLRVWLSLVRSCGRARPGPCPPLVYKNSRQMKNKQKTQGKPPRFGAKDHHFTRTNAQEFSILTRSQVAKSASWPH